MTDQKTKTLSDLGEFGLIRRLTDDIILRHPSSRKGIGDDAAVIDHNGFLTLVTTDLLLEGIHFDLTYVPMKHLGYKSVVVNLSDIYAMNGTPLQVTVCLGISSKLSLNAIEELYKGIKLACNHYEIDLIGGDTSASVNGLTISVTALGTAQSQQIIYRKGAKKGDLICVTGDLGGAYMGLLLLERENLKFKKDPTYKPQLDGYQYILGRQLKPEARNDLGRMLLARKVKPTAMIDVSDGLSSDLLHICEASGTGSKIYADRIPVHSETQKLAGQMRISPIVATLNGGEDYELLFTISPEDFTSIQTMEGMSVIGIMTGKESGHLLEFADKSTIVMDAQGWNAKQRWKDL
ncbi:MAG: thiamine-phosphate kinase [Bacteroidia bacterium]|nr:thiamine-phosphate kinase [Bacteroidia bacterium]